MSFLAPWAFWFAALLPVIVLLYLLKLRRRELPVSSLLFWQQMLQESRRRTLFQRLRRPLSLLLHLLIFILLMLALARPILERLLGSSAATVIILDDRARMQARGADGRTRFEVAADAARREIGQASATHPIALLTIAGGPSVAAPFSPDERELGERLAALKPTSKSGGLGEAVAVARDLLGSKGGGGRVLFIGAPNAADAIPPDLAVKNVATPLENVGITRFAARALPASPETAEVYLRVQNFGQAAANGQVELALGGRVIDVKSLSLKPGETSEEVFPIAPPKQRGAAQLAARWKGADALPLDDQAEMTLPSRPPARVLLISSGNWFLEKLLTADPGVEFELLAPDAFQPALAAQFDAVILDAPLPAGFDWEKSAANLIFLAGSPFDTGETLDNLLVPQADGTHPLLALVNLENVHLGRARQMQLPERRGSWTFEAPLRSLEAPLLISAERREDGAPPVRALAFGIDTSASDLPLRIAYPLLISNAIRWVAGDSTQVGAASSAETLNAVERDLRGSTVTAEDRRSSWLTVSTLWPPWQYLALAAALLFTGEWWAFHRRRTE